jgi:hypothetical protein
MEYYDSIGSMMLYTYYMQKNYAILKNPEISEILERNENNKLEKVDVFKENPYIIVEKKRDTCNYTFKRNTMLDDRSVRDSVISDIKRYVSGIKLEITKTCTC